jgi:DNA helicase-2/ATP-dependent DNA helicase PcrA
MVAPTDLPAAKGAAALKSSVKLSAREEMLADFARRTLSERGLSVTALNHFIACPARYFYKSIMKLPEAPSATAEKGNAMHAAIDAVWRLPSKDRRSIEATLIATIRHYFEEKSLLPAFERGAVAEKLIHDAPEVSNALVEHFSASAKVESETWVEARYENAQNEFGDIRIHGKLDALMIGEDKVSIFDYKTREAMSENELRGLTKDATGDYFRQLVFYKLLMATDSRAKGKVIEPSLVFVSPDDKGRCPIMTPALSKKDEEGLRAHIDRLIESVRAGDVVRGTCDDPDCKECALRRFADLNT